ncbi:MAG: hypothetical protein ACXWBM_00595 [Chthoniobacterales bacterium]
MAAAWAEWVAWAEWTTKPNLTNESQQPGFERGPAVFALAMTLKLRRIIRRTVVAIIVAAAFALFILVAAIATPPKYRIGAWQRLPILDHRLLPHLSALFAAAFGAFFGSLSAFYLGRVQQRSDRREKRHAALIAAQYALMSQWNIIEGVRVQQLESFRNDPNRFAKLKLYRFRATPTFVPFADLTFVLETKDPNLLHEVHLAEQSYHACADVLQLRYEELQKFYDNPRVTHNILDVDTGAGVAAATAKDILFLRQATDALYESVDRTLPRLVAAAQKLETLIKAIFPGKQALHMVPDQPTRSES